MRLLPSKTFFTFLFAVLPFLSYAYDFKSGDLYFNIISSSELQVGVTNNGEVANNNNSYSGQIEIPEKVTYNNQTYTVTTIQTHAFGALYSGSKITRVNIPSSVTIIEAGAFENCQNLEEIKGGENLISIGDNAFYTCYYLKNFLFGNSLISIGKQAFKNCYNLSSAQFGDALTVIGDNAFDTCTNLKSIIFGLNLRSIGANAFVDCSGLMEIYYTSSSLPSIGVNSFKNTNRSRTDYVPSVEVYGFGTEYLTFNDYTYTYSGLGHPIEWTNNLYMLQCSIEESLTEVNVGEYTKTLIARYSGSLTFSVEIPYTYTIEKTNLTVVVNNVSRKYGEENPVFSCTGYGFVNDENFSNLDTPPSYVCIATPKTKTGDYSIFVEMESNNYDIHYYYGILTILPATLTVTANDVYKLEGDDIPALTLSYNGFVNSENENVLTKKPVATTTATMFSPLGEYPIKVSGGEADNYTFNYKNGTLYIVSTLGVSDTDFNGAVSIYVGNGNLFIENKSADEICRVYDLNGKLIKETSESEIYGLIPGLYIIRIGESSTKVIL